MIHQKYPNYQISLIHNLYILLILSQLSFIFIFILPIYIPPLFYSPCEKWIASRGKLAHNSRQLTEHHTCAILYIEVQV